MAGVKISVSNGATPSFKRMIKALTPSGMQRPLQLAGIALQKSFRMQFKAEGKPTRWKPLSPMTIARRRKNSSRILQDTGRLARSYQSKTKDSVYIKAPYSLTIGSNVEYAATHQYGDRKRRIPRRPVVVLPEDRKTIAMIFRRHITGGRR